MLFPIYHYSMIEKFHGHSISECELSGSTSNSNQGSRLPWFLAKANHCMSKIVINGSGGLDLPFPPCKGLRLHFLICEWCRAALSCLSLHGPQRDSMSAPWAEQLALALPFPWLPRLTSSKSLSPSAQWADHLYDLFMTYHHCIKNESWNEMKYREH